MHIPDGFIGPGVSAAAAVVSAGGIAVAVKKTGETLEDKQAPLAGLVAAFVFAVQMLNFPVAAGTSGHLLGGVLAAVLVGPWAGAICITLVLLVQALFFADGGLSALGLNVLNMAIVGAMGGYVVFVATRGVLPKSKPMVVVASAVAAFLSVVMASIAFFVEYALGGVGAVSLSAVFAAMVGTHALIGIGEAIITALTVSAVLAVRPDLVYGARDLMPRLEVRTLQPAAGR
ncbi:MAG TPA: energy-coupling factor ABC transporter permease [Actinomycetota bacterium]|jgi:cobalt/nickel transport system permease protein